MKRIKIIADHPEHNQDSIQHLIGRTYRVLKEDKFGCVTVNCRDKSFRGKIVLNPKEFTVIGA